MRFFLFFFFLFNLFFETQAQNSKFKNLVMEGGGIKGIAYGGALAELETQGILKNIVRVGGTSAGAIQASLLAIGYSAEEITEIIASTPVESFNDEGTLVKGSKRLSKSYGWFEGQSFLIKMKEVISNRTGNADLTFEDLHKLAETYPFRDLYITGSNLTKQKLEVFSYETYPKMKIADAVRVSMSIPLYYKALWIDKEGGIKENPDKDCSLFVDGGLLLNYPIEIFDQQKYLNEEDLKSEDKFNSETLGLKLEKCEQIDHDISHKNGLAPQEIVDFGSFMAALSNIVMRNVNPPHVRDTERTIYITELDGSARVRKVPEEEKKMMMLAGQHGVLEFLGRELNASK